MAKRKPIAIAVEQGSEAWHEERFGRLTASRFELLMRRTEAAWRELAEGLEVRKSFSNAATEWGNQYEPQARLELGFWLLADIELCGLVIDAELDYVGCSPDGFIPTLNAGVEIKCPYRSDNHLTARYSMPLKHVPQVQGQLMVTGWDAVYFASFDPRQPIADQLFIHRIPRNEVYITELRRTCVEFWAFFKGDRSMPAAQAAGIISGRTKTNVLTEEYF